MSHSKVSIFFDLLISDSVTSEPNLPNKTHKNCEIPELNEKQFTEQIPRVRLLLLKTQKVSIFNSIWSTPETKASDDAEILGSRVFSLNNVERLEFLFLF